MSSMDISNLTKEYIAKIFAEGKRFDGRGLLDFRNLEVSPNISNKAEGSVIVKLGKSEVAVGIKLEIGEPYPDSPDKGNLMCTAELLPIASPRFESGPPGFKAIELGRLVDRVIRESGIIDFSKLVITPGEKVWTIFIDIYPLNDDGNLLDVSTIGATIALKLSKMPILDEDGKIDYSDRKNPIPLNKDILPISLSFFKLKDAIILDPTREEEEACNSRVTFGISKLDNQYMLNSCQKMGPQPLTKEDILNIMSIIPKKFDDISKRLKNYL